MNDVALLGSKTIGTEASLVLSERIDLGFRGALAQEARVLRPDLWQMDFR